MPRSDAAGTPRLAEMQAVAFKCQSNPGELSPTHLLTEDVCRKAGVKYEDVFTDASSMARMAKGIKQVDDDVICRLPFSVAVEAEQFGAKLSLNPETRLPAVKDFPYAKLDEIEALPPFDFSRGQLAAVLRAAEILSREGEIVLLSIEGIFSILGMTVPSKEIYKGLYRKTDKLRSLAETLKVQLAAYAKEAAARGVKIIAYTDAVISLDLVSPESYRTICGAVTVDAIRAIREAAPGALLHLCSGSSVGVERVGLCTSEAVPVPPGTKYGEALLSALEDQTISIVGHGCHERSHCPLEEPYIYKLRMNE